MFLRSLLLPAFLLTLSANAQFNQKGTFHASLGFAFGGHATHSKQTLRVAGIPFETTNDDGAATYTFPIQAQYGLSKLFSMGIVLEPGAYLDSSASRTNGLFLFAIEPRFHIVNKDRFAWMASVYLGGSRLRIDDTDNGVPASSRYGGPQYGISTGVAFQFGEMVGLQMHLRSVGTTMELREYEQDGRSVALNDYEAVLRTQGIVFQVSLGFRF